jgi:hypothetical protein
MDQSAALMGLAPWEVWAGRLWLGEWVGDVEFEECRCSVTVFVTVIMLELQRTDGSPAPALGTLWVVSLGFPVRHETSRSSTSGL